MIKRIVRSRNFNKYCVNVLNTYNFGRVNMPM